MGKDIKVRRAKQGTSSKLQSTETASCRNEARVQNLTDKGTKLKTLHKGLRVRRSVGIRDGKTQGEVLQPTFHKAVL